MAKKAKKETVGFFIFCLPFFFAIIAAVIAALTSLKVFKINGGILFGVCAGLALISVIIYSVTCFYILNKYGRGEVIGLFKNVKWAFAFWDGFALNCAALLGSVYAAVTSGKK